jgi:hypothetical protein
LICKFDVPEGLTMKQAEKQKLESFAKTNLSYNSVFEVLRSGSDAESAEALRRIREATTIEDAAQSVAEAQLLLSVALTGSMGRAPTTSQGHLGGNRPSWAANRMLHSPLSMIPLDL